MADPQSCWQFIQRMQKINGFPYQLSEEEAELISNSKNWITIGRSGTGKTTSSILRMFASEIVFKKQAKVINSEPSQLLSTDDVNQKASLHQIFITLSPILIYEVKRVYQEMHDRLNAAIQKIEYVKDQNQELNELPLDDSDETDVDLPKSLSLFEDSHFPTFISIVNFL